MTPDDLIAVTQKSMVRHGSSDQVVVIAVSGGLDSVTLLYTIYQLRNTLNISCVVAHANHCLRGIESDADERSVIAHAQSLGLPVFTERLDVSGYVHESGMGIEAAARELRYAFLTRVAKENKASVVLTAHTTDDNAETMLMNLARGSGTKGLSGIPPERPLDSNVRIVRPFLGTTRNLVKDVASSWGLSWREDSSNTELHYLRNHIRAVVMPAMREVFGPTVADRLLRSSEIIRDADAALQAVVQEILPSVTHKNSEGNLSFVVGALLGLPRGLVREVFRGPLQCSHLDVVRMSDLLDAETGSSASLSDGRTAIRDRDLITVLTTAAEAPLPSVAIERDGAYVAGSQTLRVERKSVGDTRPHADAHAAYFDLASLHGALVWRHWQDGDRFQPFGLDGTVLVSDLLTNQRVPHVSRRAVRVVSDDLGIVWVCGIRTAERTRVTSATTDILILTVSV